MIFKKDSFIFGLALGLMAPVMGFLLFKLYRFNNFTIAETIEYFKGNPNLISASISASLLVNAILFTVYINGHRDQTAKGIFVLTVAYAIVAMIFKYW